MDLLWFDDVEFNLKEDQPIEKETILILCLGFRELGGVPLNEKI